MREDTYKIINGGNIGFNTANGFQSQAQVNNQSSIIGTNSVKINVGTKDQNGNYLNNSGNLNLTAALIANATINPNGTLNDQNNLILNTHSLTYLDLENHNSSESNQISVSLQLGKNPNKPVTPGNLEINLSNHGNQSSSNSKATIGQGVININNKTSSEILNSNPNSLSTSDIASAHAVNSINRDINQTTQNQQNILTSDFDAKLKIDTRLIVAGADLLIGDKEGAKENWNDYKGQTVEGAEITYQFTPMAINKDIEQARGSEQTLYWGGEALYKSGTEPNGVRDAEANNIGQQNLPIDPKTGKLDESLVGQPVEFKLTTLRGISDFVTSFQEGGLISQTCNYAVPGCNDMSLTHDNLAGQLARQYPNIPTFFTNQMTIAPAYVYNTYGLIGKPVNMFIDYLEKPRVITNIPKIDIPVPTLTFNFEQK